MEERGWGSSVSPSRGCWRVPWCAGREGWKVGVSYLYCEECGSSVQEELWKKTKVVAREMCSDILVIFIFDLIINLAIFIKR